MPGGGVAQRVQHIRERAASSSFDFDVSGQGMGSYGSNGSKGIDQSLVLSLPACRLSICILLKVPYLTSLTVLHTMDVPVT